MSNPMYLLMFGIALILIAVIAKKIIEYDLLSHLWFEFKKVLGIQKPTPH